MSEIWSNDTSSRGRLPLPLAQQVLRVANGKTALDRHLGAFYAWEAALKLLASAAIVQYAELDAGDTGLRETLKHLARPSLGHWWQFTRELARKLADKDPSYAQLNEQLAARHDNAPRAAGLEAALREALLESKGARATVRYSDLFDLLVRYRNKSLGHGVVGAQTDEQHERMAGALLLGFRETFDRIDVLAGRTLVQVADVRQRGGSWLVQRYELMGEVRQRLETLELPREAADRLPDGDRVHLAGPGDNLVSLHPLFWFDAESEESFFLNARVGKKKAEYLCYTSGRRREAADLGGEHRQLLAHVLKIDVAESQLSDWEIASQAEEPAEASSPFEGAQRLGEFELLSELGRGGMGVVYRAWQPSLRRQVALKRLLQTGDERTEARFHREIRALGRVEHSNLVKVFSAGAEGEHWFYAMELVEGAPLSTVCDYLQTTHDSVESLDADTWKNALSTVCQQARSSEKPLSNVTELPAGGAVFAKVAAPAEQASVHVRSDYVRQVVELVSQATRAAHSLHQAGVVHRDIKPGNIMVTENGRQAVLMDLGLAQLADADEGRLTRTRQFVGTLRYASPQQVLSVGELDCRTDIYSLGATLWEMLTLQPLYGATAETPTPELMERIQRQDPQPIRKHHPGASKDLEAIVHKCLEKRADDRYDTAAALANDLDRFLAGDPVIARPPSGLERRLRWIARHPERSATLVLAGLAVILLLVGGAFTFLWRSAEAARDQTQQAFVELKQSRQKEQDALVRKAQAEFQAAAAIQQEQEALLREGETKRLAAASLVERTRYEIQAGNLEMGLHLLQQAHKTAPADGPLNVSTRRLLAAWSDAMPLQFLEDGDTDVEQFSPDGRYVATESDGTLRVWRLDTGLPIGKTIQHLTSVPVKEVFWSPNGERLASVQVDGSVRLWDPSLGTPVGSTLWHGDEEPIYYQRRIPEATPSVRFSPRGDLLLTISPWNGDDDTVKLWDANTGAAVGEAVPHVGNEADAYISSDDERLITRISADAIQVWDTRTASPVGDVIEHDGRVRDYLLRPNTATLATLDDARLRFFNVVDGSPTGPTIDDVEGSTLRFTSDGAGVLLHDSHGWRFIDLEDERSHPRVTLEEEQEVRHVHPDSMRLLTRQEQTVRLWNISTGEVIREIACNGKSGECGLSQSGGHFFTTEASGDESSVARVFLASNGVQIGPEFNLAGTLSAITLSANGKVLAAGDEEGTVNVWNLSPPQWEVAHIALPSQSYRLEYLEDRSQLLIDCLHERLSWDARTGTIEPLVYVSEAGDHTATLSESHRTITVQSISDDDAEPCELQHVWPAGIDQRFTSFSRDGKLLLTASGYDSKVRIWNVESGDAAVPPLEHDDDILFASLGPQEKTVLTATGSAGHIWDLESHRRLGAIRHDYPLTSKYCFSSDGSLLATVDVVGNVNIWRYPSGSPVGSPLEDAVVFADPTHLQPQDIHDLQFGADDDVIVLITSNSKDDYGRRALAWNIESGRRLLGPLFGSSIVAVKEAAFNPNGKQVLVLDETERAWLWDVATGERSTTAIWHPGYAEIPWEFQYRWSPNGRIVASFEDTRTGDNYVALWDGSSARRLLQLDHDFNVDDISFSKDGANLLVVGSRKLAVWHVSLETPEKISDWDLGESAIDSALFVDNGETVLVLQDDDQLQLWNTKTQSRIGEATSAGLEYPSIELDPDHKTLLVKEELNLDNDRVRFADASSLEFKGEALVFPNYSTLALGPSGKTLFQARDGKATLWNVETSQLLGSFHSSENAFTSPEFSPENRFVALHDGKEIRLLDLETGEPIGRTLRTIANVSDLAFSPDGERFCAACDDGSVHVWEIASGNLVGGNVKLSGAVSSIEFGPDGESLLARVGKHVSYWKVASNGSTDRDLRIESYSRLRHHYLPKSRPYFIGAGDHAVVVHDLETGRPLAEPIWHDSEIESMALSANEQYVATGCEDGTVHVWNVETGKRSGVVIDTDADVDHLAFAASGHLITVDEDNGIKIFDPFTGRQNGNTSILIGYGDYKLSPDGEFLLTASSEEIATLHASYGVPMIDGLEGSPTYRSFSPDSRYFVLEKDGAPVVHRTAVSLARGDLLRWERDVWCAQFNHRGDRLAAGLGAGLQIYDSETRQPVGEMWPHPRPVRAIHFSEDDALLATVCEDNSVRAWDVSSGELLCGSLSHSQRPSHVHFSDEAAATLTTITLEEETTSEGEDPEKRVAVRRWDLKTGRQIGVSYSSHDSLEEVCGFGADGAILYYCDRDDFYEAKTLVAWNPESETRTADTAIFSAPIVSSCGRFLFNYNLDTGVANVRNTQDLAVIASTPLNDGRVDFVAFSDDGSRLVTIQRAGPERSIVRVWRTADLSMITQFADEDAKTAWLNPDGATLITANESGLLSREWDVVTGFPLEVQKLQESDGNSEAFRLRESNSRSQPTTEHQAKIESVVFSPDGRNQCFVYATGAARVQRSIEPVPDEPRLIKSWVEFRSGAQLKNRNRLAQLTPEEWLQRAGAIQDSRAVFDHPAGEHGNDSVAWHINRSRLAWYRNRTSTALFHLETLTRLEPDNPEWRGWMGVALGSLERSDEALEKLSRCIADSGESVDPRFLAARASLYGSRGEWTAASDDLAAAKRLSPQTVTYWAQCAFARLGEFGLDEFRRAGDEMRQHFTDDPSAEIADQVAYAMALDPQPESVDWLVKWAAKAVESNEQDKYYRETLGAAYYRAGDYENASEELRKASNLQGSDETRWLNYFRAMTAYQQGDEQSARNWLSKATLGPDDAPPKNWMERLRLEYLDHEAQQLINGKTEDSMAP